MAGHGRRYHRVLREISVEPFEICWCCCGRGMKLYEAIYPALSRRFLFFLPDGGKGGGRDEVAG